MAALKLARPAVAQRERVEEFYLRSRNRLRNRENHQFRTVIHPYAGALHLRALTTIGCRPMAGIPEARFMNVCDGSVRDEENLTWPSQGSTRPSLSSWPCCSSWSARWLDSLPEFSELAAARCWCRCSTSAFGWP